MGLLKGLKSLQCFQWWFLCTGIKAALESDLYC